MRHQHNNACDLSVQQLYTFCHVYEEGGYAAAARRTGQSVPTVWQHIQALEKLYEVRLFAKIGRQVQATTAATELYESVSELLVGLESSFELIRHQQDKQQGTITVVAGVRMMLEDLPGPLRQFRKQFSERLVIRHGNNQQAEGMILSGEADLGLALAPDYKDSVKQLEYREAYQVEFLAISPRRHPFAKSTRASLEELAKHDLVVTVPGTHGREALDRAFHQKGLSPTIAAETDSSGFTIACVQAGVGVGVLAGRQDGALCKNLTVRSLQSELGNRQIVFMWRKGRKLTASLLGLIESIQLLDS